MDDSDDDYGDLDFIGGASTNIVTTWSETRFNNPEMESPTGSSSKIRKIEDETSRAPTMTSPLTDATSTLQPPAPNSPEVRKRPSRSSRGKKKEEVQKIEESAAIDLEECKTPESKSPSKNQENLTPPPSPSTDQVESGGWSGRRGGRGGRGRGRAVRGAAATKKTLQALKRLETGQDNPILKLWDKKRRSNNKGAKKNIGAGIEISDDDDNEENQDDVEYIKIQWKTNIERVKVRQSDRMGDVLDRFVSSLGLEAGDIYFIMKDDSTDRKIEQVARDMSVENVNVATIFKARSRKEESETKEAPGIELKVQTKDRRASVNIKITMMDKMSVLMQKYSQIKNVDISTLKFFFDGEELDAEETGYSLDLEGGECIDVHEA